MPIQQTLKLTLASALSAPLYVEQLNLILTELETLSNTDTPEIRASVCGVLSRLHPFLRHQVGTNLPTKDVIVRILRASLRHVQTATSVRLAILHSCNLVIIWYLCESDPIDTLPKDVFEGIAEYIAVHLNDPHKQNEVFDHGIEASLLLALIALCTHSSAWKKVKMEVDIFKVTIAGQSRVAVDFLEDHCKTILTIAKKEKLALQPWFVQCLLLHIMHLYVYAASHEVMYNAMVLWIEAKMYEIWQIACFGTDCLKDIALHPQPLLSGSIQDRALFDIQFINLQVLTSFTKSKMNLFWSPKYHNWWIRYKAYEGLVLALESQTLSRHHEKITALLDSRTSKENKDETRVIFASRASRSSIHDLLMKWSALTLQSVSLTFNFQLSPESCELKNLPMLFGNLEDVEDKKRIGADILSQQSDVASVERDAASIVIVFIQGNRSKDLEVAVELFYETFTKTETLPVGYLMAYVNTCIQLGDAMASKLFVICQKAIQEMMSSFVDHQSELRKFLQQIDGVCSTKRIFDMLYNLLFSGLTPDTSTSYGEVLVDMKNLQNMLFENAFLPTKNDLILGTLARMMQIPVEVMMITQYCTHRRKISMYEVLQGFLSKRKETWSSIQVVVIKLIAEFFDGSKNAESLLARIYQAVDKFSVEDMSIILTVIYDKLMSDKQTTTSTGRHVQLGQLLSSMLDIEDFCNDVTSSGKEIAKRLDATKVSEWPTALNNLQFVIFELKYPEKDIEIVAKEFLEQSVPLSVDDLNKYIAIYTRMKEHCFQHNLRDVNKDTLMKLIAVEMNKSSTVKGSEDYIVRALALIRQAVYLSKGYYPYNTQFLVVLAMIYSPTEMKGRLGQVKTGQGKSIIVNMLAAFLGMYHACIDIVTSSESLAKRDAKESQDYFAIFGLTVGHCCEEELTSAMFKPNILYGTPFKFEWAALQDEYDMLAIRSPRVYDIVIVDEVDNMLIDRLSFSTQIIYENDIFYQMIWIYDLLFQTYRKDATMSVEDLRRVVLSSKAYSYCSLRIRSILDAFLQTWLPSVSRAFKMELGKDYIVRDGEIKPVDYDNTGEIQENTKYVAALHQLLEVKEGLYPSLDSLLGSHISHLTYFNRFRRVFGLTGTMGSTIERQEVYEFYHLSTFDVPVHVQGKREDYTPIFAAMSDDWYREVATDALKEAGKQRPVLVLFESIKQTTMFQNYLTGYNKINLLNGVQSKDEEIIIAEAGQPGQITVATNMAGRGTDIRTWKESEANGGTHVIITFLPASYRVEEQAKGRTARQGKIGSVRFIFDRSDYPKKLKNTEDLQGDPLGLLAHMQRIRTDEELASSISRRKIYAPLSRCQDMMVVRICQRFAVWKRSYDEYLFRGARQQWVEWFTLLNLHSSAIEKDENFDAVKPFIDGNEVEFQKLITRLELELSNRTAIRDPLILYEKAESLRGSDPNQALSIIIHLVKDDPRCSQAYYLAARIYHDLKQTQLENNMWAACIQSCEVNLSVNPRNINDLMTLATAYKQTNQVPKAIEIIDRFVLQFTSNGYRAANYSQLVDVANLLRKNEMFHSALRVLEKTIPLRPDVCYGYNTRGLTYVNMDRFREGIEDFHRALQVNPQYKEARTNIGWAYRKWADYCGKQQRWQDALTCINESIKHDPNDSDYYVDRGYYYSNMNRKWDAKQDYLKALQINPNNTQARDNLKNYD